MVVIFTEMKMTNHEESQTDKYWSVCTDNIITDSWRENNRKRWEIYFPRERRHIQFDLISVV